MLGRFANLTIRFLTHQQPKANTEAMREALSSCVLFLLVSPYDNHQSDMMHRLKKLKELDMYSGLSPYRDLLAFFTEKEIVPMNFQHKELLLAHPSLSKHGVDVQNHFTNTLEKRTIQHNLRVVAGYYSNIRLTRLSNLLGLTTAQIEEQLAEMSLGGDIYVKIDRPSGLVCFSKQRPAEAVLSDWAADLGKLLSLMENTYHLINRENMVHRVETIE